MFWIPVSNFCFEIRILKLKSKITRCHNPADLVIDIKGIWHLVHFEWPRLFYSMRICPASLWIECIALPGHPHNRSTAPTPIWKRSLVWNDKVAEGFVCSSLYGSGPLPARNVWNYSYCLASRCLTWLITPSLVQVLMTCSTSYVNARLQLIMPFFLLCMLNNHHVYYGTHARYCSKLACFKMLYD